MNDIRAIVGLNYDELPFVIFIREIERLYCKWNKVAIGRLDPKGVKIEIIGHPERGFSGFQTVLE